MTDNTGALWVSTMDEFGDYLEFPLNGGLSLIYVEGETPREQQQNVDDEQYEFIFTATKYYSPTVVAVEASNGRCFLVGTDNKEQDDE